MEGRSLDESIDLGQWLARLSIQELGPQYVFSLSHYVLRMKSSHTEANNQQQSTNPVLHHPRYHLPDISIPVPSFPFQPSSPPPLSTPPSNPPSTFYSLVENNLKPPCLIMKPFSANPQPSFSLIGIPSPNKPLNRPKPSPAPPRPLRTSQAA